MNLLHIIVPIVVGAAIGYCTNFIAIKMLFRPRKEVYIGKWKLPFTPGIIPKNQKRIAGAVGAAVGGHLLNLEALTDAFNRNGTRDKLVGELVEYICTSKVCAKDVLPEGETHDVMVSRIGDTLSKAVIEKAKQADFKSMVAKIGEEAAGDILNNKMVAMLLNEERKDAIYDKIGSAVLKYINENGEEAVKNVIVQNFGKLEEKPFSEFVNSSLDRAEVEKLLQTLVDKIVDGYAPALIQKVDISGIVRQRVEEMDMAELETLILSVMKTELQAVINLGAVLGAVIGIINIFV